MAHLLRHSALTVGALVLRSVLRYVGGRLRTPRESELVEDAAHVILHGLLGEKEHGPDLAVGLALGELLEHLALLLGKRRELRVLLIAAAPYAFEDLAGDIGIQERTALRHRVDRVDNRLAACL